MANHIKIIAFCFLLSFTSCNSYLDIKPDKSQVVPESAEDLWALLNNTTKMNIYYPSFGEISCDNYYLDENTWNVLTDLDARNAYIWDDQIFLDSDNNEWSYGYVTIFTANVVLETLEKNKEQISRPDHDRLKGTALFFRSYAYFQLAQIYMEPYESASAQKKLGLPLRLDPDLNKKSVRSTMLETYSQIMEDVKMAVDLLPEKTDVKTLPSKSAAIGLFSKIYLIMGDYSKAEQMADDCLKSTESKIIDFNMVNSSLSSPFKRFNEEVIFHSSMLSKTVLRSPRHKVDSILIKSYAENDLRKKIYFKSEATGGYSFKGGYDGSSSLFNGIAVDEMLLIKSECQIRQDKLKQGLQTLNLFLANRIDKNDFHPLELDDRKNLLLIVLDHRRKELILRGTRWSDLRRLNRESGLQNIIKRKLGEKVYELLPNSPMYTLPIPRRVIERTGMEQNLR
ncbi:MULTISPECIES: RagB/SusD family nutrient uptake outer membrane protein [Sphingobacterium]|uniref:RagB/SusD family nutrient uptake outer membrane protein n=1 Tax=Sphingobacterium TaxID=28453 RepID=UPI00257B3599|nr:MULTISPECIES: RagB/SusD family nutrient uptake outer membrane protein [Sphingobacterium]